MKPTETETKRADYHFAVKERMGGEPWIMLEPREGDLPILEDGLLGFNLREGTTYEQARTLANTLNNIVKNVTHTRFLDEKKS